MTALDQSLDLDQPDSATFLEGLQGNILKGHGRPFTAHALLSMTAAAPAVRDWIHSFARDHVTSAADARAQAHARRETGASNPFAMFLLAPAGYTYLGLVGDQVPGTPDTPAQPATPTSPAVPARPGSRSRFVAGLKGQTEFNDPDPSTWEVPYRRGNNDPHAIHAMVLLADDDEGRLQRRLADLRVSVVGVFRVLVVEHGRELHGTFPSGQGVVEHFGFRDGISNPILVLQDAAKEQQERGSDKWDPSGPLSLVLVEEPGGGTYGSFMVFRKLEQNVRRFWETLQAGALRYGTSVEDLGAMAVGRYRDGTPLVAVPDHPGVEANNFHFATQDEKGARCPFHAHIRKTNPRGDIHLGDNDAFERSQRIVRRGITYGQRPDLADGSGPLPEGGVGLLFMSFQANLGQFGIQQGGSDSDDFVQPGVGPDAVIGQNTAPLPQTWPSTGTDTFTMANLVTMRGGEYFFAPSMAFLTGPMAPPAPTAGGMT